jgi:hypothetical protein
MATPDQPRMPLPHQRLPRPLIQVLSTAQVKISSRASRKIVPTSYQTQVVISIDNFFRHSERMSQHDARKEHISPRIVP